MGVVPFLRGPSLFGFKVKPKGTPKFNSFCGSDHDKDAPSVACEFARLAVLDAQQREDRRILRVRVKHHMRGAVLSTKLTWPVKPDENLDVLSLKKKQKTKKPFKMIHWYLRCFPPFWGLSHQMLALLVDFDLGEACQEGR